jgi:hypothetical protein
MRSVFSRIALMLNTHLGGAFYGMRSTRRPKSGPPELDARRFARKAAPVTAPPTINGFFIFSAPSTQGVLAATSPAQYPATQAASEDGCARPPYSDSRAASRALALSGKSSHRMTLPS